MSSFLPGPLALLSLNSSVRSQMATALQGRPLSRAQDAPGASTFMEPAQSVSEAYIKIAFWLAVASRMVQKRTLLTTAAWYAAKAQGTSLVPVLFDSHSANEIAEAYQQGAEDARAAGATAVARLLLQVGSRDAIERARWGPVLRAGALLALGVGAVYVWRQHKAQQRILPHPRFNPGPRRRGRGRSRGRRRSR